MTVCWVGWVWIFYAVGVITGGIIGIAIGVFGIQ